MIFEFLGNSGSGKSTLIPILIRILQDEGLIAMSMTEAIHYYMRKTYLGRIIGFLAPQAWNGPILWRVFSHFNSRLCTARFALQNPRLMCYVIKSQLRRPIPRQHRRLILRLFFQMAGGYHFLKSRVQPDHILILDEAFVHRVVHMFASESEPIRPDQVLEYLKLLPRSDLVIMVQAPLEMCLARIHARGLQVRLRGLEARGVERFMMNAEQVVGIASQYLKEANWEIIEVENNGDLEVCSAELCRSLTQYFLTV
jgi:thymidylate kinase